QHLFSCFPHFWKKASEIIDFTGLIFDFGCCKAIFNGVFAQTKESFREYFCSNHLKSGWEIQSCKDDRFRVR
ncbi:MAG TPA: hypothetical protein VHA52_08360, partial [Candidatus Babeliaceae bacterium]|nr:hypothetical protein [Candidatus Babeliaceae bacterium]